MQELPHQEYAGRRARRNPATPAPLLCRNAGFSAPQTLAIPAEPHHAEPIRIAFQMSAADLERWSQ